MKGYTLIEILIVIAIIGILAALAYPSFINYKIRVNRAEVQTEMLAIASELARKKAVNHNYAATTITNVDYPKQGTAFYKLNLVISANKLEYELTATPIETTIQRNNGVICLNEKGYKFWQKGQASCSLSVSSKWHSSD
jgi:type IV pilus assembly protein PilE